PCEWGRPGMADTAKGPLDRGTFGSMTTPTMGPQMRRASAAARALLIGLAAERWGVDRGTLTVAGGKVAHAATSRTLGFGELTHGRKLVETIGDDAKTTPASEWKVAGQSVPKVDGRAIVTGRHRFASDVERA